MISELCLLNCWCFGVPTVGEPFGDGVDDFSVASSFVFSRGVFSAWRVIPPQSTLRSTVISYPLGGVVSSLCRLVLPWGSSRASGTLDKSLHVPNLDKFFYLILKGLTFLDGMSTILVVPAPLPVVGIFWA